MNYIVTCKGVSSQIPLTSLFSFIEVGCEIYEVLGSGDKKYIGVITRRGLAYICLDLIERSIEILNFEKSKVEEFILNARECLNQSDNNADLSGLSKSIFDIEGTSLNKTYLMQMLYDCQQIILGCSNDYICDVLFLYISFPKEDLLVQTNDILDSKNPGVALGYIRQSKFIIDFLESGKHLFYL